MIAKFIDLRGIVVEDTKFAGQFIHWMRRKEYGDPEKPYNPPAEYDEKKLN